MSGSRSRLSPSWYVQEAESAPSERPPTSPSAAANVIHPDQPKVLRNRGLTSEKTYGSLQIVLEKYFNHFVLRPGKARHKSVDYRLDSALTARNYWCMKLASQRSSSLGSDDHSGQLVGREDLRNFRYVDHILTVTTPQSQARNQKTHCRWYAISSAGRAVNERTRKLNPTLSCQP